MPDQILDSEQHLRTVFTTAINAVVTMDGDGLVTGWNPRAATMFGWDAEEAIGRPVAELIVPPAYREKHKAGLSDYHATGHGPVLGKVSQLSAMRRDGTEFPVELSISPASKTATGVMFVAFIHDVSERLAAEQLKASDAVRIAELERTKSLILSVASHELRGPIALLNGYLEMIADGSLGEVSPALARVLPTMTSRVKEMALLVAKMLETARLEDPDSGLHLEQADLRDLAQRGGETIRAIAPPDVVIELTGVGVSVLVDVEKVQTAVNNLIENAVKYSPGGGLVRCHVSSEPPRAILTVEDFGLGIPPTEVGLLFTRFGRLSNSASTRIGGIGLGLYISREIARLHGGDITARSREGEGSTFTLSLPLDPG